jgi:hypothetical protein
MHICMFSMVYVYICIHACNVLICFTLDTYLCPHFLHTYKHTLKSIKYTQYTIYGHILYLYKRYCPLHAQRPYMHKGLTCTKALHAQRPYMHKGLTCTKALHAQTPRRRRTAVYTLRHRSTCVCLPSSHLLTVFG